MAKIKNTQKLPEGTLFWYYEFSIATSGKRFRTLQKPVMVRVGGISNYSGKPCYYIESSGKTREQGHEIGISEIMTNGHCSESYTTQRECFNAFASAIRKRMEFDREVLQDKHDKWEMMIRSESKKI